MDKNYCRLCLKQDTWNSPLSVFAEGFEILSKIFSVYGIQIVENDSFSKVICHLCLAKLEFMDGIRKKVAISNSILNGIVGEKAGESGASSEVQTTPQLEKEKPVDMKCDRCQFVTNKANDLSLHVKLHNSLSVRNCPRCSLTVLTEDDLAHHMKRKHKGKTLAVHYCSHCTKLIYGTEDFNRHCRQHSAPNNATSTENRKKCASEDVHRTKKKHKKDRVKDSCPKSGDLPRERIVLKISKTASIDDEDSRQDSSNVVANTISTVENNIQKLPEHLDNDSQTNINHSQTFTSSKSQTSITNKENVPRETEAGNTTPVKKKRRMSACFVPISPINIDSVAVNGLRNDVPNSGNKSAVPGCKNARSNDLEHDSPGLSVEEKNGKTASVPSCKNARSNDPGHDSSGLAVEEKNGKKTNSEVVVKNTLDASVKKEGESELKLDKLKINGENVPVELLDSSDSDLEIDELFTNDSGIDKWLSNATPQKSRKHISSSIHLQSPVVGKLLRQGSINLKDGNQLPSSVMPSKLASSQQKTMDDDILLCENDWDPVFESQRIYIDVDNDDDVLEINDCRQDQTSDGSCKSFMSLNRLELEDAMEIKEEF